MSSKSYQLKATSYFKFCPRCGRRLTKRRDWPTEPARPTCPTGHFTFYNNPVTANEALIIRDNKLLMVVRAAKPRKGWWDFPGGFMEGAEDPKRSVAREIREELGVRFKPTHLLGAYIDTYRWRDRNVPVTVLSYVGSINGSLKNTGEVSRYAWVSFSKLPDRLAFKHMQYSLRDLKRYLKTP